MSLSAHSPMSAANGTLVFEGDDAAADAQESKRRNPIEPLARDYGRAVDDQHRRRTAGDRVSLKSPHPCVLFRNSWYRPEQARYRHIGPAIEDQLAAPAHGKDALAAAPASAARHADRPPPLRTAFQGAQARGERPDAVTQAPACAPLGTRYEENTEFSRLFLAARRQSLTPSGALLGTAPAHLPGTRAGRRRGSRTCDRRHRQ
jgi:hypothetical protein